MAKCTDLVIQHLRDFGPATTAELCRHIPHNRHTITSALELLRKNRPVKPRCIHIHAYTHDDEIKQRYPRAIYAFGNKPDAKRPPPENGTTRTKRWRDQQVVRTRDSKRVATVPSSVFNWRP
jgi:tRNA G37 N-methylase Trm5